jgi:hypothetical protein
VPYFPLRTADATAACFRWVGPVRLWRQGRGAGVGRGEAGGGTGVVRGGGAGCGTGVLELVRGVGVGSVGSKGALQDGLRKRSSL